MNCFVRSKVKGAIQRCEALPESHCRHTSVCVCVCLPCTLSGHCGRRNVYDGELEYWVTVRETGKRREESSMEKSHTREEEACVNCFHITWRVQAKDGPKWALQDGFTGLDGFKARGSAEKQAALEDPNLNKYVEASSLRAGPLSPGQSPTQDLHGLPLEQDRVHEEACQGADPEVCGRRRRQKDP